MDLFEHNLYFAKFLKIIYLLYKDFKKSRSAKELTQ